MKYVIASLLSCLFVVTSADAGEVSHYNGGFSNIRDFMVPPDSGLFVSSYNFYYQTGRLNDADGREKDFVFLNESGSFEAIDPDIDIYMMAIPILYVEKDRFTIKEKKFDVAFLVTPTIANSSIAASLSTETGRARDPVTSQFGLGDTYVQPLWIGHAEDRYSLAVSWGFHAPTGKYDTRMDNSGTYRVPSIKNIGLGFWTNQFRAATQLSPWGISGPALVLAGTYEINSRKEDLHLTPGDHFTLNWGLSDLRSIKQINAYQHWFVEYGIAGYDSWQTTDDRGKDRQNGLHDQVHAAGFQIGITSPKLMSINFHYFNEYHAEDRFQGHVIGLNLSFHFLGDVGIGGDFVPPPPTEGIQG